MLGPTYKMLKEISPVFIYGFETADYIENFHEYFGGAPRGAPGRFVRGVKRMRYSVSGHEALSWVYGIEVDMDAPNNGFIPPSALIYLSKGYGSWPHFQMAIDVDCNGWDEWNPDAQERASISELVGAHLVSLGCVREVKRGTSIYTPSQPEIFGSWERISDGPASYVAAYPEIPCDICEILKNKLGEDLLHASAEKRPSGAVEVALTVKTPLGSLPAVFGVQPTWKPIPLDLAALLKSHPRKPKYIGWKLWVGDYLVWGQDTGRCGENGRNIVASTNGRVGVFSALPEGGEGIVIGPHRIAQFSPDGKGFITDLRTLHQVLVNLPVDGVDLYGYRADEIKVGEKGIYFNKIHLFLGRDGKYSCGPIPKGTVCAAKFYDKPGSQMGQDY
jgi:hypothetical protein